MSDAADPTGPPVPPRDALLDDVPRLPRGRGLRLSRPTIVRIAGTVLLLVFLIVAQRPCADSVSKIVTGFGSQGSAAPAIAQPGTIDMPTGSAGSADGSDSVSLDPSHYEHLRPGMTDAEVKAVIERAKAKAAAGSAGSGSAGSGSAGATR